MTAMHCAPGAGGGLRLDDVLVDVAGRDDRVEQRKLVRRVGGEPPFPLGAVGPEIRDRVAPDERGRAPRAIGGAR